MFFKFTAIERTATDNAQGYWRNDVMRCQGTRRTLRYVAWSITATTTIEELLDLLKKQKMNINDHGTGDDPYFDLLSVAIDSNNFDLFDKIIENGGFEPLAFIGPIRICPLSMLMNASQSNPRAERSLLKILDTSYTNENIITRKKQIKALFMANRTEEGRRFSIDLEPIILQFAVFPQPEYVIHQRLLDEADKYPNIPPNVVDKINSLRRPHP